MSVDYEIISDFNMVRYYRRELTGIRLGIRPPRGTLRALNKLGFISIEKRQSPKPFYTLTEKAAKLLEGVSP